MQSRYYITYIHQDITFWLYKAYKNYNVRLNINRP